ncbi:MAG: hypothetical protein ACYCTC_02815 [Acidithiobacillus ferrooxidans]
MNMGKSIPSVSVTYAPGDTPHRTQNLPQILAGLTDDELARWPGDLVDAERERRHNAAG